MNEQAATTDRTGFYAVTVLRLVIIIGRKWLREGQAGVAAAHSLQALLTLAVAQLITRRRATYVRHRELFAALCMITAVWSTIQLGLQGGTLMHAHGGNPRATLGLLLVHNGAVPILMYSLYLRTVLPWSAVMLPLLAVLPLWQGERVCLTALEAPGLAAPLASLYHTLDLLFNSFGFPASAFLSDALQGMDPPLHHCLVVSHWSVCFFGVALPLFVSGVLEQAHWDRQLAQHREQQPPSSSRQGQEQQQQHGDAAHAAHGHGRPCPPAVPEQALVAPGWIINLFLTSCLIWAAVSAGQELRRPAG